MVPSIAYRSRETPLRHGASRTPRKLVLPSFSGGSTEQTYKPLRLIALHFLAVASLWYVSYFTPEPFALVVYLIATLMFLLSQRNAFWFALVFVLWQSPAFLFDNKLPLFSLGAHLSLDPRDVFAVAFLLKAMTQWKSASLFARPALALLSCVGVGLIISTLEPDFFIGPALNALRPFFYYALLLAFPLLVRTQQELLVIPTVLFPWVVVILMAQFHFMLTGTEVVNRFLPGTREEDIFFEVGRIPRPLPGGTNLLIACLILGLAFALSSVGGIKKAWLGSVVAACCVSFVISGTRQVVIFAVFVLVASLMLVKKRTGILAGISILCLIGLMGSPGGAVGDDPSVPASVNRLLELRSVQSGGIESIATGASRLEQTRSLLAVVGERPLLGWGFCQKGISSYNNNLGLANTLLLFGLVGTGVFAWFCARVLIVTLRASREGNLGSARMARIASVLAAGWLGLLMLFATVQDFLSGPPANIILVVLMAAFCDHYVRAATSERAHRVGRGTCGQPRGAVARPAGGPTPQPSGRLSGW
jgi:hypothetical protein